MFFFFFFENVLVCRNCTLKYLGVLGLRLATYFQIIQGKKSSLYYTCNLSVSGRILVPWQGSNSCPLQRNLRVLIAGLPGKSLSSLILFPSLPWCQERVWVWDPDSVTPDTSPFPTARLSSFCKLQVTRVTCQELSG